MKLLYITETLPWGKGESFFYPEIRELIRQKVDVKILTTFPGKEIFHREGHDVHANLLMPVNGSSSKCFTANLRAFFIARNLHHLTLGRGSFVERGKKAVKNIRLFTRAKEACESLSGWKPDHIHAQWANYTATLAWMISEALEIPWSFTAHRYDLLYDNLLAEKSRSASFVRVTSEQALQLAIERKLLCGSAKSFVSYMGVDIPSSAPYARPSNDQFVFAVPAALIERKGHSVLLRALKRLKSERLNLIKVHFYGDGPRRSQLMEEIRELALESVVELKGALPHKVLLQSYGHGLVDCVVLPSLNFGNGLGEGIPFSLIEAMAHGIPVITTRTGGSPELLKGDSGLLVEPGDEADLAQALETIVADKVRRQLISESGFERVNSCFSIKKTTEDLLNFIRDKRASN